MTASNPSKHTDCNFDYGAAILDLASVLTRPPATVPVRRPVSRLRRLFFLKRG